MSTCIQFTEHDLNSRFGVSEQQNEVNWFRVEIIQNLNDS